MRRREFITLLGTAAAWPLAVRAQQPAVKRVGVLMGSANNPLTQSWTRAFQQELERLGWVEGRNIVIEYRWAEERSEPLDALAAQLVRLKVDIIVTEGTQVTATVKQATSVIPIVFWATADPVGTGLVHSLARPDGNVTGLSGQSSDLAGKRVELLREIVPSLERFLPTGCTQAPTVAGFQAAKAKFRHRSRKIIAAGFGELEKRDGHDDACSVATDVLGSSVAAAVSKEPRHWVHRTDFQAVAEHIAG